MKVFGQLEGAALEIIPADTTAGTQGRIYYNSTSGRFMLDSGTSVRAILRNDGRAVLGTDATAANNVRLHRAGAAHLQFVPGNDTTAEGTVAASVAQLGFRLPNFSAAPAVGNLGRLIYNTTTSAIQVDIGAAYAQLATLAGTETLTNKTLVAPVADVISLTEQAVKPANPPTGSTKLYTRAGQFYRLGSDGIETLVGSGTGGGDFNYITNGDFESDQVFQYATATLVNGLPGGVGPTITTTPNTVTQTIVTTPKNLSGNRSLSLNATGVWQAGHGVALGQAFKLQLSDWGKVLSIKVDYAIWSVLNVNNLQYSGKIGSQSLALAVYDVTAGKWVDSPPGALGFTSSTVGSVTASFQASSGVDGQQYQLFLFNLINSGGPVEVLVDSVRLGRQNGIAPQGTLGAQLQTLTTTSQTAGSPVKFTTTPFDNAGIAAPGAGTFTASQSGLWQVSLTGFASANATSDFTINVNGTIRISRTGTVVNGQARMSWSIPVMLRAGDVVTIVPAITFTAVDTNVTASMVLLTAAGASDTGEGRVVAARAQVTPGAVAVNTNNILTYTLPGTYDSHGGLSSTRYTVQQSGWYKATFHGGGPGTNMTLGFGLTVYLLKNGVQYSGMGRALTVAGSYYITVNGSDTIWCNAGDYLQIALHPESGTAFNVQAAQASFERLSGASVAQASESVNATYSITTAYAAAAGAIIKYDTRQKDTHTSFSAGTAGTGLFTCPASGTYRVSVVASSAAVTGIYVNRNGTIYGLLTTTTANVGANSGSLSISCQAGDTLGIYTQNAATFVAPGAFGIPNQVTFEKTGN